MEPRRHDQRRKSVDLPGHHHGPRHRGLNDARDRHWPDAIDDASRHGGYNTHTQRRDSEKLKSQGRRLVRYGALLLVAGIGFGAGVCYGVGAGVCYSSRHQSGRGKREHASLLPHDKEISSEVYEDRGRLGYQQPDDRVMYRDQSVGIAPRSGYWSDYHGEYKQRR